jgi:predicted O-methyltransferase YrrM
MDNVPESLSLNTPWAIGEDKYKQILQVLSNKAVEKIVEFGSGISTVRLGKDFPDANIISVEHNKRFYKQTLELLGHYQIENVRILYCSLKPIRIGLRWYLTYDLNSEQLESEIDFILIDGPVESQTIRGREAPLYMIFSSMKSRALVVSDDYHRKSARTVVRNWQNTYRDSLKIYAESDDLIWLQKCNKQNQAFYPSFYSIADNMLVNISLSFRALRHLLKRLVKRER